MNFDASLHPTYLNFQQGKFTEVHITKWSLKGTLLHSFEYINWCRVNLLDDWTLLHLIKVVDKGLTGVFWVRIFFCQESTVVDVFINTVFAGFVYEITIKKLCLNAVIFFCKIHSQFEKLDKFQGFVNNRIKLNVFFCQE